MVGSTISSWNLIEVNYVLFMQGQLTSIMASGVEAGKKAAGEVLALQKRVLQVLNEARYVNEISLFLLGFKIQVQILFLQFSLW